MPLEVQTLAEWEAQGVPALRIEHEILVVNDNSSDNQDYKGRSDLPKSQRQVWSR